MQKIRISEIITMSKNITITLTFDEKDWKLKVQATNENITKNELVYFLDELVKKVKGGEYLNESQGDYVEETFDLLGK